MAQILNLKDTQPATSERVGDRLLAARLITADQLKIALHEQRRSGDMLGGILVRLGFLRDGDLAAVLAERTGFAPVDLTTCLIDDVLMRRLPPHVAQRCRAIPLRLDGDTVEVAVADPYDVTAMDEIRRHFAPPLTLIPLVAPAAAIAERLSHYEDGIGQLDAILAELETGKAVASLTGGAWEHPVIRLVNTILADGVRRNASDIHFEPESRFIRLRYRIDGSLQEIRALHRAHWPELSHRLKIVAGLNIADTRSLQDGRFEQTVGGAAIDFRVAVMPTAAGENIVIRILDHRRALLPLEQLGFTGATKAELDRVLDRPEGIILVTGPTGSGKTTTLYSILTKLSASDVNIMTLEEPIEYRFEMIRQTAIRDGQGLSFADGVRGILRQDPDIIFIGEVRDPDTAQMALRAAMTGHQVFSTLHCNDALGALPRLIDLGLHPRMLAGHVAGVVAQRLVRKLCPHCKGMRPATGEEDKVLTSYSQPSARCTDVTMPSGFAEAPQNAFESPATTLMLGTPVGCDLCNGSGYRGRVAIAEVLRVTPALDELIAADAPRVALKQQMLADGFRGMAVEGIAQVLAGAISLESLRRAVDLTRLS